MKRKHKTYSVQIYLPIDDCWITLSDLFDQDTGFDGNIDYYSVFDSLKSAKARAKITDHPSRVVKTTTEYGTGKLEVSVCWTRSKKTLYIK